MAAQLSIGTVLFHWSPEKWRDFYFKLADEAPIDRVYVGEVVCYKRDPFYKPLYGEVMERLKRSGKEVVFSTLAEVMLKHDRRMIKDACGKQDFQIEANDASALWTLDGKPHAVGPFMNVYNEDTMAFLAKKGATHFCLPYELPRDVLAVMGNAAKNLGVSLEVQVYGRIPLALSARCYHARAHGKIKDNCQFVCGNDSDGMELKTISGQSFLTINGIQTMSHDCLNLIKELHDLESLGIGMLRLSPHDHDMIGVAKIFRAVLNETISPCEATAELEKIGMGVPFSNGLYHKKAGYTWHSAA